MRTRPMTFFGISSSTSRYLGTQKYGIRWLETYDLSNVSHGVKLQIVHEMEERLRTGLRFNLDKDDLDELYPDQFWKNFDLLAEVMLLERVDRYFALPESQRIEYLSAQVDDFVSWPIVAREMSVEPIDDPDS
ncbi:MAG: hypothetical protein IH987_15545, partial [Planctomycetes bacterium]|nr:hypothetical protein [Planctomycetota bacterium]